MGPSHTVFTFDYFTRGPVSAYIQVILNQLSKYLSAFPLDQPLHLRVVELPDLVAVPVDFKKVAA